MCVCASAAYEGGKGKKRRRRGVAEGQDEEKEIETRSGCPAGRGLAVLGGGIAISFRAR